MMTSSTSDFSSILGTSDHDTTPRRRTTSARPNSSSAASSFALVGPADCRHTSPIATMCTLCSTGSAGSRHTEGTRDDARQRDPIARRDVDTARDPRRTQDNVGRRNPLTPTDSDYRLKDKKRAELIGKAG